MIEKARECEDLLDEYELETDPSQRRRLARRFAECEQALSELVNGPGRDWVWPLFVRTFPQSIVFRVKDGHPKPPPTPPPRDGGEGPNEGPAGDGGPPPPEEPGLAGIPLAGGLGRRALGW